MLGLAFNTIPVFQPYPNGVQLQNAQASGLLLVTTSRRVLFGRFWPAVGPKSWILGHLLFVMQLK